MYYKKSKTMTDINPTSPPAWLIQKIRSAKKGTGNNPIQETNHLLSRLKLHTVCDSARCPNRNECFSHHTATFLILGDVCTRTCTFCAVRHGHPEAPDADEPERLAQAVSEMGLLHAVITSVTRDDLEDGGASHYAEIVRSIRTSCPEVKIELLVPDFKGSKGALETVLSAQPDILAHNIETVPELYRKIRSGAVYTRSLRLLAQAKMILPRIVTKSGIMLGLGEENHEIASTLKDLSSVDCDMLTIGQYLSPSLAHAPVKRYALSEEFDFWQKQALTLGFKSVASGPLVRSSYKASRYFGAMA
jgi:lipoyl synthase